MGGLKQKCPPWGEGGGGGGYREMSSDGGLALRLELLLHSLFSQEIKPVTSDELNCVRPLFFPRE